MFKMKTDGPAAKRHASRPHATAGERSPGSEASRSRFWHRRRQRRLGKGPRGGRLDLQLPIEPDGSGRGGGASLIGADRAVRRCPAAGGEARQWAGRDSRAGGGGAAPGGLSAAAARQAGRVSAPAACYQLGGAPRRRAGPLVVCEGQGCRANAPRRPPLSAQLTTKPGIDGRRPHRRRSRRSPPGRGPTQDVTRPGRGSDSPDDRTTRATMGVSGHKQTIKYGCV